MEKIGDDDLQEEIDAIIRHIDQTVKKIESVLPQRTGANPGEATVEPETENQQP